MIRAVSLPALSQLQLQIPWALRALVQRPLSRTEELLEVLAQDGETGVRQWACPLRGRIRDVADLAAELERLEAEGGPVARALVDAVHTAWREFGGPPLPSSRRPSREQPSLPLAS
jgi:hypothetical protein